MRRAAALLAVLDCAAAPGSAGAASFNDIEDEVMCVSCNVPLNIAESPQAEQEREELRGLVAKGLSKDEIKDELVRIYGPNVLAEPAGDGFDLFAWIVPIGAALGLVALGLVLLPRWRRTRPGDDGDDDAGATPALDPSEQARVDADMARLGV
jgi:cytochrome c-type biogenesis protein CcmH/NrfF